MAAPLIFRPGTEVGGYTLEAVLGAGAFGAVYLARRDGHLCALKLLWLEHVGGWAEREVALLLRLKHRHVVRFLGCGYWPEEAPRFLYVRMEYVEGQQLDEWARAERPGAREVVRKALHVARALAAVHAARAVHRDVKEANVLVRREDGEAVLVDLGAGVYEGAPGLTLSMLPPGTSQYRAPEAWRFVQEHAEDSSARYEAGPLDDVYALGVVLYRLLVGMFPHADGAGNWMERRIHQRPTPPQDHNSRVPVAVGEVCLRLLAPRPEDRIPGAQAACAALEGVLSRADERWDVPLRGASLTPWQPVLPGAHVEAAPRPEPMPPPDEQPALPLPGPLGEEASPPGPVPPPREQLALSSPGAPREAASPDAPIPTPGEPLSLPSPGAPREAAPPDTPIPTPREAPALPSPGAPREAVSPGGSIRSQGRQPAPPSPGTPREAALRHTSIPPAGEPPARSSSVAHDEGAGPPEPGSAPRVRPAPLLARSPAPWLRSPPAASPAPPSPSRGNSRGASWRRVLPLLLAVGAGLCALWAWPGPWGASSPPPVGPDREVAALPATPEAVRAAVPRTEDRTPAATATPAMRSKEEASVKQQHSQQDAGTTPAPAKPRPASTRAALASTCLALGVACATGPQLRPPPPESCPVGAVDAMKSLGIHVGQPHTVALPGERDERNTLLVREGETTLRVIAPWRNMPDTTLLFGRLYFGEQRVYGRFTRARMPDNREFPICMEIYTATGERGVLRELGEGPGTARMRGSMQAVVVDHFE